MDLEKMKVLHVTNWFPTEKEPLKGVFIKRHIKALNNFCSNKIVYINLQESNWPLAIETRNSSSSIESVYIKTFIKRWRVVELFYAAALYKILRSKSAQEADVINFHIAYPQLVYFERLKKLLKFNKPVVVTMHWSAYHFNFQLPAQSEKLIRIQRIFHYNLPLIAVSKALIRDVERFSRAKQANTYIVPNVVNTAIFRYDPEAQRESLTFFALNDWRSVKNPHLMIDAFKKVLQNYPEAKLYMGGGGPLWEEIKEHVRTEKLEENIQLLGWMTQAQIAYRLNRSTAFVISSDYETFSITCAEALCCGTPIIAPEIPAIMEYAGKDVATFVSANSSDAFAEGICNFIENQVAEKLDHETTSIIFGKMFSEEVVGRKYFQALQDVKQDGQNNNNKTSLPANKPEVLSIQL